MPFSLNKLWVAPVLLRDFEASNHASDSLWKAEGLQLKLVSLRSVVGGQVAAVQTKVLKSYFVTQVSNTLHLSQQRFSNMILSQK